MNVPVLVIKLHGKRIGCLFKYEQPGLPPILRFAADEQYARLQWDQADVLSESTRADDPAQQQSFWLDVTRPEFNTVLGSKGDYQLPPFFQNLLPEGVFRRFVAEEADIDPLDHMRMIAACGKNMPGAVTAEWEDISRSTLQRLVTQNHDALEATVWAEPFQDALSISGVQPKIGVNKAADGRFVGRTSKGDAAIIAKLPSSEYARMPQLESLSMELAGLAGVDVCQFELVPMSALAAPHRYDLGDELAGQFLAVTRFDRDKATKIHFEDFAQVFGMPPEQKYAESYIAIAAVLLGLPRCGEAAVHELLRRIEVNELLGNADMHLKNLGLIYRDRRDAELAPAYDITSTILYNSARGHALTLMPGTEALTPAKQHAAPIFNPARLQEFCNQLGLQVAGASKVIRDVAAEAAQRWSEPILASGLTARQKLQLLTRLSNHPHLGQAIKRLRRPELLDAWNQAVQSLTPPSA